MPERKLMAESKGLSPCCYIVRESGSRLGFSMRNCYAVSSPVAAFLSMRDSDPQTAHINGPIC